MIQRENLPESWVVAPISHIADLNVRSFCPLPGAVDELVHFVPMSAVEEEFGGINISQRRPLGEVKKGYTSFLSDDVLFAKITPCMENGKVAIVPALPNHVAYGSTEFHVLRAQDGIRAAWLAYFISQSEFRRFARQHMTGSAGQLRVSASWLSDTKIPIAPSQEQTRIVDKLEELLSDLDAGVAELRAAQKKLGRYRQSLLKAAVEGTLTAEWRTKKQPAETGAQLLERILNERRARWEAKQLAKFKEQGKTPPKDWQKKYPEPVQPDTTNLLRLPDGWVWATLEQLSEFITSGSRGWAEYYAESGATFIRSQNINKDRLDLSDIAFVRPPASTEGSRTRVRSHDLLLTITGANVGKAAWVEAEVGEVYVSQHVALIRPIETSCTKFLHMFLIAVAGGRGQLNKDAYGAGKPGLNLQQVGSVTVPLPSLAEILALEEAATRQLMALAEQALAIEFALKQSAIQRKNLLNAAFSGQLVPQDASDEPASVLLARIRAERVQRAAQPRCGIRARTTS